MHVWFSFSFFCLSIFFYWRIEVTTFAFVYMFDFFLMSFSFFCLFRFLFEFIISYFSVDTICLFSFVFLFSEPPPFFYSQLPFLTKSIKSFVIQIQFYILTDTENLIILFIFNSLPFSLSLYLSSWCIIWLISLIVHLHVTSHCTSP